jgi:dCTP deaminase
MLLVREDIRLRMREATLDNRLVITPLLDESQVGPASIDLRLGSGFIETLRRGAHVIDPSDASSISTSISQDRYEVPLGESLYIHPGQFLLGATFEFVRLPRDLGGQVLGRSSWGRLGLMVATAVTVQPGFGGCLTLELQNLGSVPIRLFPGLRVAQLMLWQTSSLTKDPYPASADFQARLGPESPRTGWEESEVEKLVAIGKRLQGNTK